LNETESWALKSAASVIHRQLVAFVELEAEPIPQTYVHPQAY